MRKRPVTRALLLLLATAIGLGGCAAEAPPAAPCGNRSCADKHIGGGNHGLFP